jgi:hypothetical protein
MDTRNLVLSVPFTVIVTVVVRWERVQHDKAYLRAL